MEALGRDWALRLTAGLLLTALTAATQGCWSGGKGRPVAPNSATEAADTSRFGPPAESPHCLSGEDPSLASPYPGPGPNGIIYGYVAAGLDSQCAWRQRSAGAAGVSVELFSVGPDSELHTNDDLRVADAKTDASGCYQFDGVDIPETYIVKLAESSTSPAVCDSDSYTTPEVGVARVMVAPIIPAGGANFGIDP